MGAAAPRKIEDLDPEVLSQVIGGKWIPGVPKPWQLPKPPQPSDQPQPRPYPS